MDAAKERFCAWCGPVFVVLFFTGMLMAGLLPPPSPNASAHHIAHLWSSRTALKQLGLVVMMISAGFQAPFGVLIAMRIRKMEGPFAPLMFTAVIGVGLTIVAVLIPVFVFSAISFRPEAPIEITKALNNLGWLAINMNFPGGAIVCLCLAFAIFGDRQSTPTWPRWVAYFNLYIPFSFVAGGCCIFFRTSAFTWNGLLGFWIGAAMFGIWFLLMTYLLLTSIDESRPSDEALAHGDVDGLQTPPRVDALAATS